MCRVRIFAQEASRTDMLHAASLTACIKINGRLTDQAAVRIFLHMQMFTSMLKLCPELCIDPCTHINIRTHRTITTVLQVNG